MPAKRFPTRRVGSSTLSTGLALRTGGFQRIVVRSGGVADIRAHDTRTRAPLAGLAYRLTLADGSIRVGILDREGRALVEGVPDGPTTVIFLAPPSTKINAFPRRS